MNCMPDIAFERGLPASIDAERSILGGILLDNAAWFEASQALKGDDFVLDSHCRIFMVMGAMLKAGHVVDIVTLNQELKDSGQIEPIGGLSYLFSLTEGLPRRISIWEYVQIVKEKSQARQLIKVGAVLIEDCNDQSLAVSDMVIAAERSIRDIAANGIHTKSLEQSCEEVFESIVQRRFGQKSSFLPSGIDALDQYHGGMALGEMTVVAARPKQGKSSLGLQFIRKNCSAGVPVDLYSMEMREPQVLERLISQVSGVPFWKIRNAEKAMNEIDQNLIRAATREISRWPLWICDEKLTAEEMVSKARAGQLRRGTRYCVLDYLQKMRFPGKDRFLAVSVASGLLADLPNQTGMGLMVMSSLTPKSGKARNEPPTFEDIRFSGDVAFDAHTLYLIHRPVNLDTEKLERNGQIIAALARSADGGAIDVTYDSDFLMFS